MNFKLTKMDCIWQIWMVLINVYGVSSNRDIDKRLWRMPLTDLAYGADIARYFHEDLIEYLTFVGVFEDMSRSV